MKNQQTAYEAYQQEHRQEFFEVRINDIESIVKAFKEINENKRPLNEFETTYIKQALDVLENDIKKIRELV